MAGDRPALLRRLAALIAITGLVGALVAAGVAVIRGDAWRVPLVIVAAAVAVVGLWYALSRRGVVSVVGAALAVAGLLAVILVIVTTDHRGLPFVVASVLMLVSATTARYALGRDRQSLRTGKVRGTATPRPSHPVLIMNPKSGGGKVQGFGLVDECRARGIEPVLLHPGDDLLELARLAIADGADVVGMAGGDGSQALVASGRGSP